MTDISRIQRRSKKMKICNHYFYRMLVLTGIGLMLAVATLSCEDFPYEENSGRGSIPSGTEKRGIILVQNPGQGNDIRPNLEAAWKRASAGDTIYLPAGSFMVSGTVNFSAGSKPNFHLRGKGSGPDGTRLYREEGTSKWMFSIQGGQNIEVSNIWFQGTQVHFDARAVTPGSYASYGIVFGNNNPYVHHCKFQWFTSKAIAIANSSGPVGCISNNEFIDNVTLLARDTWSRGYGIGVQGSEFSWDSISPGSSDFLFVEDNFFSGHRHAIAGSQGALFVFRFNRVERNTGNHTVDMHGARPKWQTDFPYSARFAEIYNNIFTATPSSDLIYDPPHYGAIGIRGGSSLIWGNTFHDYTNRPYSIVLKIEGGWYEEYFSFPQDYNFPDYPIPYQIGWDSGTTFGSLHEGVSPSSYGRGDVFIWDNDYRNAGEVHVISPVEFNGAKYDYIQEGRDYHLAKMPNYIPYLYPHPRR